MPFLLFSPTLTLHAPAPAPKSRATQIVLQPAPDPVPTGTCTVQPLDVSGAVPVVEVMIDGKGPYRFGIDTGAQGMGRISSDLAAQLNLMSVGEVQTPVPGGTFDTRKIYRAQTLAIGGMTFSNADLVTMATLPNRPTNRSGILGIDLFKKVTLTLDYGRGALKLSREPLTGGVPAKFDSGIPSIPLKVGNRELTVDLDTSHGAARGDGNLGSRGLAGMQLSVDRAHGRVAIKPSGAAPTCP